MFSSFIISKSNLLNNILCVQNKNPNSKICAMVKADAYGVGLKHVVPIIEEYVDFFGVANVGEAKQIRDISNKKILIVGPVDYKNINTNFSYAVCSLEDVRFFISVNKEIKIHIKINTGMNRYGFNSLKEFKQAIKMIEKSKLIVEGLFTHFATSDKFVNKQMLNFSKYINIAKDKFANMIVHADNSVVSEIKNHNLNMVRVGYNLYNQINNRYQPIVRIKSKIVQINLVKKSALIGYDYRCVAKKKMKVAIVPIGYADGFDMSYIGIELEIENIKCKVLNICMDCFMLDITKTKLKKGDEIFLLNEINNLNKYASFANTTPYQVMTRFSSIRADKFVED